MQAVWVWGGRAASGPPAHWPGNDRALSLCPGSACFELCARGAVIVAGVLSVSIYKVGIRRTLQGCCERESRVPRTQATARALQRSRPKHFQRDRTSE